MTTTITITKENFWQKVSLLYKRLNSSWKIKIRIDTQDDKWDNYTSKNNSAYLEAKKQLKKWETISFEDLKAKYK